VTQPDIKKDSDNLILVIQVTIYSQWR